MGAPGGRELGPYGMISAEKPHRCAELNVLISGSIISVPPRAAVAAIRRRGTALEGVARSRVEPSLQGLRPYVPPAAQ